ncbi:unnamed protein product [Owenia fusiformis]|uniref:UDENN FLCN/SMCR8-type domain-containing protein n=1 Tax=Owenia fusiformis TaxID=6347 RepID=A0A8S4PZ58_OWEFU|nr:unnamed protein product [Owenia fusiformis]
MFGGYTDIAQFYWESEDTEKDLPHELLPNYDTPDPWSLKPTIEHDFILMAEFSELEGPKPLITVPSDCGTTLDLNAFVVRVMSTDYQTTPQTSGHFTIMEDTSVVMNDSKFGISAFAYHFTLYDTEARGFVRPFCMCYVTADHRKIMPFYKEMSDELKKVSRYLKYGNLMLFLHDLQCLLADLNYTKEKYVEWEREQNEKAEGEKHSSTDGASVSEEDRLFSATSLANICNIMLETEAILDKVKPLLNDSRLEKKFNRLEEKALGRDQELTANSHESGSLNENLTDDYAAPCKKSGSFSDLHAILHPLQKLDTYKPKLMKCSNRRVFDTSLRNLHGLCNWGAKEGLNRLRSVHKYFRRDLSTLQIERDQSKLTQPPSTLLSIGNCVNINYLHGIDLQSDEKCLDKNRNSAANSINHPTTNLLRRWLSDETLASYKSTESFLSFSGGTPDSIYVTPNTPGTSNPRSHLEPAFVMGSAYLGQTPSSQQNTIGSFENIPSFSHSHNAPVPQQMSHSIDAAGSINSDFSDISATESNIDVSEHGSSQDQNEATDDLDINDLDLKRTKVIISAADHISQFNPQSIGYGILEFAHKYTLFSPHLLYSLLSGHTTVVIGNASHEREVTAIVRALHIFVPGHSFDAVVPWRTKPIKMADIAQLKLVGLCRPRGRRVEYMVPPSIQEVNAKWIDIPGACLYMDNIEILKPVDTMDACKKLCEDESEFTCMSVDYNAGAKQCQLQEKYSVNGQMSDPCHAGPAWSYAEISVEGTIDISVDNGYDLFVDGVKLGSAKDWRNAERYTIDYPQNAQVIAVKGMDWGVAAGIILSFRYGDVLVNTDSSWKCTAESVDASWNQPGFDDSTWPEAKEYSTNRDDTYVKLKNGQPWWPLIDPAAIIIWTGNGIKDSEVYCRKTLKAPAPSPNAKWIDIPGACLYMDNIEILKPVDTMDACKILCEDESEFTCMSIDYNAGAKQCQLQEKYSRNGQMSDPCHAGPAWSYAEISVEGTIDIAADDAYDLFVDGVQLGSAKNWRKAEQYTFDSAQSVQVIAVKGMDLYTVVSGIILSFRYDDVLVNTDSSWKCFFGTVDPTWNQPGFDDSNWPAAIEYSTNRDDSYVKLNKEGQPWWPLVDQAARMIWTSNGYKDSTVYCRKNLKAPAPSPKKDWVDIPGACLYMNNKRIIKSVDTMDACKILCEDESEFTCMSVDYNAGAKQCQLQEKYSGNNPINDPCHAGPAWSYTEISVEGTIDIAADDAYDLFVNGVQLGSAENWRKAEQYTVDSAQRVQVIAVKGMDLYKVVSGIILSFRYGDVLVNTDSSWKCFFGTVDPSWNQPGFDDSNWPAAIEYSTNRDDSYVKLNKEGQPWWPLVDQAAIMIWTSNSYKDSTVYCRKNLKVTGTADPTKKTTPAPTTPKPTPAPTTPKPTTKTTPKPAPAPKCGYIGQLLADKADPCRFYQCAYADAFLNLKAVSMPCAPGTSVPLSYNFVTVFDVERQTLWAPQYQGNLITVLVKKRQQFLDNEQAFVAYIHCFLMDLSMKSFLYYHGFCLSKSNAANSRQNTGEDFETESLEFLNRIGITEADAKMVQNFAEVVKWQQTMETFSDSPTPTPTVQLQFPQSTLFKM